MLDLSDRPDPECLSFDQLIEECHALRGIIADLAPPADHAPKRGAAARLDPAHLSPIESRLFLALADKPSAILSASALRAAAYRDRTGDLAAPETITVHLSKLRQKLTGTGLAIANVWGRGWYLEGNKVLARRSAAEVQAGGRAAAAAVARRNRPGRFAGAGAAR